MSLLIDALRKAEADRQRAAGNDAAPPPEASEALSLEPIDLDTAELQPAAPRPAPSESPRTTRPQRPAQAAPPRRATAASDGQAAARNMFASKQQARPRFSLASWAIGIGLCIAAIGSTYVWYEIQPRGIQMGPAVSPPGQLEPRVAQPAPSAPPAAVAEAPMPPAAPSEAPQRTSEPSADDANEAVAPAVRPPRPQRGKAAALAGIELDEAPVVRRGMAKPANPAASDIETGYAAYLHGELDAARERYAAALRYDPRAADAINGLGAVALQGGRPEEAERWFRQALTNNPADPVAQAGLLSLSREGDPIAIESRLKGAITHDPDVAASHFALGALQARTGRWADAQQSFFRAYSLEPDNPDYRFNLAVTLDHLNKPTLAAQYYGLALAAAAQRPAHFDREAASQRLKALTPQ